MLAFCIVCAVVAVVAVVLVFLLWINNLYKMDRNRAKFVDPIAATVGIPAQYSTAVRNYYIKSSYNSCASGEFSNDWVDLAALTNAIKHGCRLLDFEIYDIHGEPAVAVSNSVKYTIKSCYNSLPLGDVFKTVKSEGYTCSNGGDPLFLNLRIKSINAALFGKIATLLSNNFAERLLGNTYSYEFGGQNIASLPLSDLAGKIIIIADLSNKSIQGTPLMEYVNLGGNSAFNRVIPFTEVAHNPPSDLAEFVKKSLTMCVPDLNASASNYDSSVALNQGIQMVAMCYQSPDANLELYDAKFNRFAFVEKPAEIQYEPPSIESAPPLPDDVNYSAVVSTVTAGGFPQQISVG